MDYIEIIFLFVFLIGIGLVLFAKSNPENPVHEILNTFVILPYWYISGILYATFKIRDGTITKTIFLYFFIIHSFLFLVNYLFSISTVIARRIHKDNKQDNAKNK